MNDKELADIVCRALLAIVSGIRKRYELPQYKNIIVEIREGDSISSPDMLAENSQT